ncbi:hypothetical protein [Tissierella pigra]|uniref:hypothetical protein n=1 Tax=Tissierella pigra TaxID=2607614 RepID=UPI0018A6C734|nr:hypothetical protein [Tissierella pigra]
MRVSLDMKEVFIMLLISVLPIGCRAIENGINIRLPPVFYYLNSKAIYDTIYLII